MYADFQFVDILLTTYFTSVTDVCTYYFHLIAENTVSAVGELTSYYYYYMTVTMQMLNAFQSVDIHLEKI